MALSSPLRVKPNQTRNMPNCSSNFAGMKRGKQWQSWLSPRNQDEKGQDQFHLKCFMASNWYQVTCWDDHLKEAKANPTQLHRVWHHLLELLSIARVFWHPQLILTTFVLHLSQCSHFPGHWNPFCWAVIKNRQRKALEKKVWFFSPPWNTSKNSSKSPCRVLFSLQVFGLCTDIFEPVLCCKIPMQNGLVWVLQVGSKDQLWELDTGSGWAEETTSFQQLQDGCQAWNWSKRNSRSGKRKSFGDVKLGL